MAALDADFWILSMLFKATDATLGKVVPQTGLRMLIHEHLSKFILTYKEDRRAPDRALDSSAVPPKNNSPTRLEISDDDSSDDLQSTDYKELESDDEAQQDELQDDTSNGLR